MSPRDRSHVADIIAAGTLLRSFLSGVGKDTFDNSPLLQSAVIRQLEVIGEATKRLSDEFKQQYPDIPWRQMAGMRDLLIHAYDHVDTDEVWNAANVSIVAVLAALDALDP